MTCLAGRFRFASSGSSEIRYATPSSRGVPGPARGPGRSCHPALRSQGLPLRRRPLFRSVLRTSSVWIRARLEFLASIFGIDCLTYTVLSNHLHIVLRSRPDIVNTWTDEEIARRWLRLFPKRKKKDGSPAAPSASELHMITADQERLKELRSRLSDISWWMRCTSENIAKQANREDECTGRFWEGRFRAQLLLDEASLLACAAYVDLNPIRAALAETPETSEFTGAKDRIDDLKAGSADAPADTHAWERSRRRGRSGWMSPLEINERLDPVGPEPNPTSRRASQKGFLPMSLARYLELLGSKEGHPNFRLTDN